VSPAPWLRRDSVDVVSVEDTAFREENPAGGDLDPMDGEDDGVEETVAERAKPVGPPDPDL